MVTITDAKLQPIIGVEADASDGTVYHVLTLVITAKNVAPQEFVKMKKSGTVYIDVV